MREADEKNPIKLALDAFSRLASGVFDPILRLDFPAQKTDKTLLPNQISASSITSSLATISKDAFKTLS